LGLQAVIKDLLAKYNYISLPGFGSFVQVYEPAKLTLDGKGFLPPKQVLTFDPNRVFNDEVLEHYIQDLFQLPLEEAKVEVEKFVAEVKQKLDNNESEFFQGVGTLKRDEKGSIQLQEADEMSKASSTFGLKPVAVEEKVAGKVKHHFTTSTPVHTPIQPVIPTNAGDIKGKRRGKPILIGFFAAVIFAGLMISTIAILFPEFLTEQEKKPLQKFVSTQQETDKSVEGSKISGPELKVDNYEIDKQGESKTTQDLNGSIVIQADKKKALYYEEPKPQDLKTYYIISGSFSNMENAQNQFNQLLSKGHKPEILEADGKYRVAISKFTDRNRALRELDRLRQENPSSSVWLLGL
jgi:nucleoid DNA-binding protein